MLERPKTLGPVIMAVILALMTMTTAPAATAAGGASISGKVSVPQGADLKNAYVAVSGSNYSRQIGVAGDGSYRFDELAAGTYKVRFDYQSWPSPDTAPASPLAFADVPPGTQFETEINWMASQGISTGWLEPNGAKTYRPLAPVNRDAMAAFMHRLAGKPDFSPPPVSPFTDLAPGDMFYKEIVWLAARYISTGWTESDGSRTFRPSQPVTRDAMAAFMYRLAGRPAFDPPATSPFADVTRDNIYYHEITWLAAQDISTGWPESDGTRTFRPLQPVNRDAMAAFMFRFNSKFSAV
jgi:hypothetical protein